MGAPWTAAWALVKQAWGHRPRFSAPASILSKRHRTDVPVVPEAQADASYPEADRRGSDDSTRSENAVPVGKAPNIKTGNRKFTAAKWMFQVVIAILVVTTLIVAGLCVFEDNLVYRRGGYYHVPPAGFQHEEVWITTDDAVRLHTWYCPAAENRGNGLVVIYFHGTFGELTYRTAIADRSRDTLHADVVLFDYRGYGLSEGTPCEAGLYRDSRAVYRWLVDERKIDPRRIILVGRSLGGAVALELASNVEHRALVLESTFTSITEMADEWAGGLPIGMIMRNRFPSLDRIRTTNRPVLIAHGDEDQWIGIEHAYRLYENANQPKRLIILPNHRHVDNPGEGYYVNVRQFLSDVSACSKPK